jgi:hypothetical protein
MAVMETTSKAPSPDAYSELDGMGLLAYRMGLMATFGTSMTSDNEVTSYQLRAVGGANSGQCLDGYYTVGKTYFTGNESYCDGKHSRVVLTQVDGDVRFTVIQFLQGKWVVKGPLGWVKSDTKNKDRGHVDALWSNTRAWSVLPEGTIL